MTYRKLTKDEVLSLASRIRFEDDLDFPTIRAGIKDLFGVTSYKATLHFGNEYNDEGYDMRPNKVEVWDVDGKLLTRATPEDGYDEELHDFFCDIKIGDVGENADIGEVTVFLNETKALELPDLFVIES